MIRYYNDLIKTNKQWLFAGVYADRAITGTKTDKREEFQSLIQDCMAGKIDMVITKSIPRFARNTLDTLKYVRLLKERNIAVYFENEHINTLKDGEFLITILSSVAQQEVENTSANVKKGLKMKMKRGELVGFQGCLGYDYNIEDKTLSINQEGAETVKYIFERYAAGAGGTIIARELNEQGKRTIRGNPWTTSSILGVIGNEKYKGDILLGKTFTVDPISKRRLANNGEEDKFYIKDHHEPIISEELFEQAQEIRLRRRGGKNSTPKMRQKFSRQYAFSCLLVCGFCGAGLSRRSWHSNSKYQKTMWQCVKATKHGKRFCPDSKGIPESVIEEAFVESYKLLSADHSDVFDEFISRIENALKGEDLEKRIHEVKKRIQMVNSKRKKLLNNFLDGIVAQDVYEETDISLQKNLSDLKTELELMDQQLLEDNTLQKRIQEIKKMLSKNSILESFDRDVFESIIDKVIVGGYRKDGSKDPYKITFIYKTGFKSEIGESKARFEKLSELCSNTGVKVEDVYTYPNDDTCRDGSSVGTTKVR